MKTRSILSALVLLAAVTISFTSCTEMARKLAMTAVSESTDFEKEDTVKWGSVIDCDLDLPLFSAIDAKGVVRVVFVQDSVCSVRVHGNEKCLDEYKFVVKKGELNVEPKNFTGSVNKNTAAVTLFVTAPNLTNVEFSGAGNLEMPGAMSLPGSLSIEIEGAGEMSIDDLTLTSLNVEISGAGKCELGKVTTTEDVEIEVNGAGDVKANVFCQDLSIEINGAGKAELSGECRGTLSCEQSGASKIDTSNLKR